MVAVSPRDRRGIVPQGQLLARVLANGLEHQVARAVVAFLEHHQRFLDQRLQQVEHVLAGDRLHATHHFGRGEIEAANEHAEPVEHDLLFGRKQLVRPVDQRAQGLLPFLQDARAAGQQLVAVLQAGIDVGDGERADARGGELDRQRESHPGGAARPAVRSAGDVRREHARGVRTRLTRVCDNWDRGRNARKPPCYPAAPTWESSSSSPRSRPWPGLCAQALGGRFQKHEGYLEADELHRDLGRRPPRRAGRARGVRRRATSAGAQDRCPILPEQFKLRPDGSATEAARRPEAADAARRRRPRSSTPATPGARAS